MDLRTTLIGEKEFDRVRAKAIQGNIYLRRHLIVLAVHELRFPSHVNAAKA